MGSFHFLQDGRITKVKVREGYVLRSVLDEKIVLPKGEEMVDFSGAIVLAAGR